MAGGGYKLFSELNPQSIAGGPINCVLFIKDATLLVSGGDDQIVRLWDVKNSECLQELRDPQWGQITALSWLPEKLDTAPVLFIGTGRGVVSTCPFSQERTKFIQQASATTVVFRLDDSVEVQALDSSHTRFAVASHSGHIRLFGIEDTSAERIPLSSNCLTRNPVTLLPLWTFQVEDIPRSLFFLGDRDEQLVIHTCCLGAVIYSDAVTGEFIRKTKLHGGVGSATLSADGNMKAVYNLSSGDFDVYQPQDSLTPITLPVPPGTRLIKQCVFAEEDNRTLVCGGDNGTINIFHLNESAERKFLSAEGPDAFYAVTTFSTTDYHFIAGGESEEPASIFIWRKPTKKRAAENRKYKQLQADKESVASRAAEKEMETKALKDKLAAMEKMIQGQHRNRNRWSLRGLLLFGSVCVFWLAYQNGNFKFVIAGTQGNFVSSTG